MFSVCTRILGPLRLPVPPPPQSFPSVSEGRAVGPLDVWSINNEAKRMSSHSPACAPFDRGDSSAKIVPENKGCKAEVTEVGTTIKARFSGGVLEPLEKLDLREGEEVTVTILALPPKRDPDWLGRTAGGWVGLIDGEKLKQKVYESRLVATRPEPRL